MKRVDRQGRRWGDGGRRELRGSGLERERRGREKAQDGQSRGAYEGCEANFRQSIKNVLGMFLFSFFGWLVCFIIESTLCFLCKWSQSS